MPSRNEKDMSQRLDVLQTELRNNDDIFSLVKELALRLVKEQNKIEIIEDKLKAYEKDEELKRAEHKILKAKLEAHECADRLKTTQIEALQTKVNIL